MDSAPLLAFTLIVGVPVLFIATRIFLYPFTGLCLWVLLLPVTKTMADLAGYPQDEGPIVLQKLTLADPVLLLTAVAALLNGTGSSSRVTDRQGRRIIILLAAFCVANVASAAPGGTGAESLIELAPNFWLRLSPALICQP